MCVIHSGPARAFSSCVFGVVAQRQVHSFPPLLSAPSTSSSMAPTSLLGRTRSWCQTKDAPARWSESGRLVDSASTTKLNRTENDEMFDLKTNVLIWGLFMSTTMKSAINLGMVMIRIWSHARTTTLEGSTRLFDV